MTTHQDSPPEKCSFCAKPKAEVVKLIAGPTAFICDECVEVCKDMLKEEGSKEKAKTKVKIGRYVETQERIDLGDIERCAGLYVLGKPRMGKSTLLVNLLLQDVENGHGAFFLDPHGDAIEDFLKRVGGGAVSFQLLSLIPRTRPIHSV